LRSNDRYLRAGERTLVGVIARAVAWRPWEAVRVRRAPQDAQDACRHGGDPGVPPARPTPHRGVQVARGRRFRRRPDGGRRLVPEGHDRPLYAGHSEDPKANAERGQRGLRDRFLREIDEETPGLTEKERQRRPDVRYRLHMKRLAFASRDARKVRQGGGPDAA
jgi:hypothetical protein